MAYTTDDLARLQKAIASGVKSVTYSDGRVTTYQSAAEMMKVEDRIKDDIAASQGQKKSVIYLSGVRRG
ncbi:phage head-tail joining protein [Cohaesibacter celericrescens]|uniref:phage head-tail joining protein n=1 Tax=Cohaesibacter celericrescens TaxID=2067669 RepID=UPI003561579B